MARAEYREEFVECPFQIPTVFEAVLSAAKRVKHVAVNPIALAKENESGTRIMLMAGRVATMPINVKLLPGSTPTSTYVKLDCRYNASIMQEVLVEIGNVLGQLPRPAAPPPATTSPTFSPDGRYIWDGADWKPVPTQATPATVSPDGKYLWDGNQWKPIGGQLMDEIRKLTDLRDHGHLNQREYDDKKAELLARL